MNEPGGVNSPPGFFVAQRDFIACFIIDGHHRPKWPAHTF